ncbi:hypothetical protein PPGU19_050190 [Paraburkholderia sp. PGU19]|nr:hypothetical protein PPGU19_050190 [Paraburkholderia sp. PGU19]
MQRSSREIKPAHVQATLERSPLTPDVLAKGGPLGERQSVFALRAKSVSTRNERKNAKLPYALGKAKIRHPVEDPIAVRDNCRLNGRGNSGTKQTAEMLGCEIERNSPHKRVMTCPVAVQTHLDLRPCGAQDR